MFLNNLFYYNKLRPIILPLKEIDSFIPNKGKIVDLGCGEGIISRYLARKRSRQVMGIDINEERILKSHQKNLKFTTDDIRKVSLGNIDAVILSDVLHHLTFNEQKGLIISLQKSLTKNGILIIKEIDTKEFIRSRLSRIWDFILYPKDKIFFNNSDNLVKLLKGLDLKVRLYRPCRFFPGSTTLFVCKK